MVRGDLRRCLIVAPGNLVEQWQDELYIKFGLNFDILSCDRIQASRTGNVFEESDLLITRLDMELPRLCGYQHSRGRFNMLSRNEDLQARLQASATSTSSSATRRTR